MLYKVITQTQIKHIVYFYLLFAFRNSETISCMYRGNKKVFMSLINYCMDLHKDNSNHHHLQFTKIIIMKLLLTCQDNVV